MGKVHRHEPPELQGVCHSASDWHAARILENASELKQFEPLSAFEMQLHLRTNGP